MNETICANDRCKGFSKRNDGISILNKFISVEPFDGGILYKQVNIRSASSNLKSRAIV